MLNLGNCSCVVVFHSAAVDKQILLNSACSPQSTLNGEYQWLVVKGTQRCLTRGVEWKFTCSGNENADVCSCTAVYCLVEPLQIYNEGQSHDKECKKRTFKLWGCLKLLPCLVMWDAGVSSPVSTCAVPPWIMRSVWHAKKDAASLEGKESDACFYTAVDTQQNCHC